MVNPLHNQIFFDDYHRFVLQDVNLTMLPTKAGPKKIFNLDPVAKGKKGKTKEKSSEN